MNVIDASFAGAWFLPDEISEAAERVVNAALGGKLQLAAPELWLYEMNNLLLSATRCGRLTSEQLAEAQALIGAIPCTLYDHREHLSQQRLARLALRYDLTAYDAAYLELADRLQCPLHTNDIALKRCAAALGLLASS